jgi:hypothetical protein
VLDALSPEGVKDVDMPLTPMRVWQVIDRARERRNGESLSAS